MIGFLLTSPLTLSDITSRLMYINGETEVTALIAALLVEIMYDDKLPLEAAITIAEHLISPDHRLITAHRRPRPRSLPSMFCDELPSTSTRLP